MLVSLRLSADATIDHAQILVDTAQLLLQRIGGLLTLGGRVVWLVFVQGLLAYQGQDQFFELALLLGQRESLQFLLVWNVLAAILRGRRRLSVHSRSHSFLVCGVG